MSTIQAAFGTMLNGFTHPVFPMSTILAILAVVTVLTVYLFACYRLVSHRAFYNRSFHISMAVLPFFVSMLVGALQTNIIVTLATGGALALIRYRSAVKDPTDMVYILWAIFLGATCGCQMFEVAIVTSLVVTVVMLILEHLSFGSRPFVVVLHLNDHDEAALTALLKQHTKRYHIKSRNFTAKGLDYAVEVSAKDPKQLSDALAAMPGIARFTVIAYDAEDMA